MLHAELLVSHPFVRQMCHLYQNIVFGTFGESQAYSMLLHLKLPRICDYKVATDFVELILVDRNGLKTDYRRRSLFAVID